MSILASAAVPGSFRPLHGVLSLAGALGVAVVSIGCAQWAARAAGIPLSFPAAMGSLALLNFGMTLPLSLGGLGLQEALFLLALTPLGCAPGAILAMSCLLHLQRVAIILAGGVLFCLPAPPATPGA